MHVSLTRTVAFRATHRYFRPEWDADENRRRFGSTSDEPGHAHDYRCAVTVSGVPDSATAMVMDLAELDRLLAEEITARFAGRHLNLAVPEFGYGRTLPTCEALARHLYDRLGPRLPAGIRLDRVRVAEDATLHADCAGPA